MIEIVGLLVAVVLLIYVLIRRRRNRKHEMVLMRARARLRGYILDSLDSQRSRIQRLVDERLKALLIFGWREVGGQGLVLGIGSVEEVESSTRFRYRRCSFSLRHPVTLQVVGEGVVTVRIVEDYRSLHVLADALVCEIVKEAGRLE